VLQCVTICGAAATSLEHLNCSGPLTATRRDLAIRFAEIEAAPQAVGISGFFSRIEYGVGAI
jgi:hypothetical protein